MSLLVSTSQFPLRLVTVLSVFGALANLIYSIYVLSVAVFKPDVAAGWVSISLQQSGMFFLISVVLLVLGEYVLHMSSVSNEGPRYHVGQEFMQVHVCPTTRSLMLRQSLHSQSLIHQIQIKTVNEIAVM